jgi:hypothetical protein
MQSTSGGKLVDCTKTLRIAGMGIALSEKQIPQIVGNVETKG